MDLQYKQSFQTVQDIIFSDDVSNPFKVLLFSD